MTLFDDPKCLELAEVFLRVLCDKEPDRADALFIHGEIFEPRIEKDLLSYAARIWHSGKCQFLVINGLNSDNSKERGHGYEGYEAYFKNLVDLDVPEDRILLISPSENTAEESENFLRMAKDKNWRTLIIEAAPYHQLRCFLQIVASMKKLNIHPKVYSATYHDVDWNMRVKRKVRLGQNVLGQKDEEGPLIDLIRSELERIEKYAVNSKNHTRSATIKEALDYFRNR